MKPIPIRIFDANLNFLCEIDNYTSLILTRSYFYTGTLELYIPLEHNHTEYLKKGNIIMVGKDRHKNSLILRKTIFIDDSGTQYISIMGLGLDGLLKRRITVPPTNKAYDTINSDAETVIKHYIETNATNPYDSNRRMDIISVATNNQRGPVIKWDSRYKELREEISNIQLNTGLGLITYVNYNTKKIDIDVYQGVDRTIGNRVIFSPDFDNIQSQEFVEDLLNYKNFAYVAGQGEGVDRLVVECGNSSGTERIERIETFIDGRDIDNSAELIIRGQQKLQETPLIETFIATTLDNTFKYEIDWDLGDLVVIQNKKWGVTLNSRVTEVRETYEDSNIYTEVTFGNTIPTLIDMIKRNFGNINNEVTK